MKRIPTLFLKGAILLVAILVLAALIRFPQTEGRAANLDFISIYMDPLIIYIYIALIPFFVILFQAFKLLGYVDKNKIFSETAVTSLRHIKYCAAVIIAFFIAADAYLFITERGKDDIAGGVAGGLMIVFISLTIAATATVFEGIIQNVIQMKLKNATSPR